MNFHILTLFPEMVIQGLKTSITGRAVENNKIVIDAINIRDFSENKHRKVDDYPYGGGAGMLMQAQPVFDAVQSVFATIPAENSRRVLYVTPQGKPFTQKMAEEFSKCDDLLILCGHYEGIDERVLEEVATDYVSIGDYVLTGGELAAMVIVDAVARLVPGVLHNKESAETESFHGDLLEYPQYSRPEVWHGKCVPEVLLSGNQKKIRKWRIEQSIARTKERRPDLYQKYQQLDACKNLMLQQKLLHIDMLELIGRGYAKVVRFDEEYILLKSIITGDYYHTALDYTDSAKLIESLQKEVVSDGKRIVLHQEYLINQLEKWGTWSEMGIYYQYVYTNGTKIPVRGMYRPDGMENQNGLCIKPLEDEIGTFAAYVNGKKAGSVAIDSEGAIHSLEVYPQFQRQHIGMTLEVYAINYLIEQGFIPFLRVKKDDEVARALQDKLKLYRAKGMIYIFEKIT